MYLLQYYIKIWFQYLHLQKMITLSIFLIIDVVLLIECEHIGEKISLLHRVMAHFFLGIKFWLIFYLAA